MTNIKNTDNPNMLVYYLYHTGNTWQELNRIAKDPTETLPNFYRAIREALIAAPSKPYTNIKCNKLANTVRLGRAKACNQAKDLVRLVRRNFEIYGGFGYKAYAKEPKEILTDTELDNLDSKAGTTNEIV